MTFIIISAALFALGAFFEVLRANARQALFRPRVSESDEQGSAHRNPKLNGAFLPNGSVHNHGSASK